MNIIRTAGTALAVTALLLLSATIPSAAQDTVQISRAVIGNGGGMASNGSQVLYYTIGQPGVGIISGGSHTMKLGFWYGIFDATESSVHGSSGVATAINVRAVPNLVSGNETELHLQLMQGGALAIEVYSSNGELQRKISIPHISPGTHAIRLQVDDLESGSYRVAVRRPGVLVQVPITIVR